MRVRFTIGYSDTRDSDGAELSFIVNRGDFEMARIWHDRNSGLYQADSFDWSKGPPYKNGPITDWTSLDDCKKAIRTFLNPLPEPPGAVGARHSWR